MESYEDLFSKITAFGEKYDGFEITQRTNKDGTIEISMPSTMTIDSSVADVATEAISTVMDVNGEPMKLFLATDEVIEKNHIQPVTNSISFDKGAIPTPDGVFSQTIFGTTQSEKILNHAYIDLRHKFFHPYVYEVLKELHRNVDQVLTGEKVWTVVNGKFQEVKDESDKNYNPENTGLDFVIKNFSKLSFTKNDSIGHNDNVEFMKCLTEKEALITKFLVIPRFYRDYSVNGKMTSVDPINNMYTRLISLCNSLDSGMVGYASHKTLMAIQHQLVDIRAYGQKLIEKKEGMIHRSVLGRNVSFGSRGVISVPSLVGADLPEDCQVDMIHTGLPLSYCVTAGYPLIIKWLMDWVARELPGGPIQMYMPNEQGVLEPSEVRIKDHGMIFTRSYLDKQLLKFVHGFGGRWEPVQIEREDGEKIYMHFKGEILPGTRYNEATSSIVNRPLTWCDLIYMAAVDMLSDKHVFSTRYPAEDYFNTTICRISVLSTIKTMPMLVNGRVYQHYPVINPFEKESIVSRSFIDTISPSNLHLSGMGADYDGDTVSIKIVFSQEANEEAEKLIFAITNYITINGNLIRKLGNESVLCLYNMTRRMPV